MLKKANNYWQTLRKDFKNHNVKLIWLIIKLTLFALRLICKLIDFFYDENTD